MSILNAIEMSQRRNSMLASTAAVELLAPTAIAGLVVSIGDVLRDGKAIHHMKLLNQSFKKIKHAVMVANRDQQAPRLKLESEEADAMDLLIQAVKSGVGTAITTLCEGLFTFIPFAIETVVVPMFTVATWAVLDVLPLILTPEGLAVVGAVAAGTYFYRRWKEWESGKSEPVDSVPRIGPQDSAVPPSTAAEAPLTGHQALGIRNNNPGNLRYARQPSSLASSGEFAEFATQGQGLYNLGRQIELNYSRGLNTVEAMVSTWAPKKENNTEAYIEFVSKKLGVKRDQALDLSDPEVLGQLMKAIILRENGTNPYSDSQIQEAAQQSLQFAANGYKDQILEAKAKPKAPEALTSTGDVRLVYPTTGTVSSPFGHRKSPTKGASTEHQGVDIAGSVGTPVVAAADGQVEIERTSSSYGNFIQLRHSGFWTRYGHLSGFAVKQGESVVAGQRIGSMGSTGISTGAHLHFEVQPFTAPAPVDPGDYLADLGRGHSIAATEAKPGVIASSGEKTFVNQDSRIFVLNS